ncbi:MAG: hypothetical protein JSV92_01775 [archaeon]|nr:MAG: hypothetical protein JSV92_01775 [archaeon]
MARIRVEDECEILPRITAKNVPNPHSVYPEIKEILISRCKLNPSRLNERVYEHTKGEPEKIHIFLEAWKNKDKYTRILYELDIDIVLHPVNKPNIKFVGDIDIEIKGTVETNYPQKTALQKSIVWDAFRAFYEKALYGDLREEYMEDCKKYVIRLRDGIQGFLDLLPKMT